MILRLDGPPRAVVQRTLSVPGVTLTEARYNAGSRLSMHTHRCASVCMVLDGVMMERLGARSYEVGRYDVLYKAPDIEHADAFGADGARVLVAEIDARWLAMHYASGEAPEATACLASAAAAELTQRMLNEFSRVDVATPLAIQSLCLELLVNVSRTAAAAEQRRVPPWLRRAREILHDGYTQQLSLDELAKEVGVHPVHLAQVFRKTFGVTIGDYTRRLRVRRGSRALLSTQRTIAEIAMDCGFCDQSHFSRVFKLITSATPAEYRRAAGVVQNSAACSAGLLLNADGPSQ